MHSRICDFILSSTSQKREMLIDEYLLPVSRKSEFTNSVNRIFDYANAFLELIFGIDARRETNIKFNTLQFRAARNVWRVVVYVFAISNLHCTLLDKERDKSASSRRIRSIGFNYTAWREVKERSENLFDGRTESVCALRIYIPRIKAP